MSVRFFNPGLTYQKLKPKLDEVYFRVMSAGDLILRKDVEEFEKRLAEFIGTKYAVALNSGTDALYLVLRGLGIRHRDEVIVPSRTFVATAQVVVQLGATPVFYDIDGDWKSKVTERTKAIIPVHIEGDIQTDMEGMLSFAKENNIHVIEDAAQAFGATQKGKKAGSLGIAGCFSFYPAKILGAFGDAGGVCTNDEELYKYLKDARDHFKTDARDWGVNSRLDNLQAAFLNVRLKRIDEMLSRREAIAAAYNRAFADLPVGLPPETEGRVWQDYLLNAGSLEVRERLFFALKEKGIETLRNNYPFPVPKLPGAQLYEDSTLRLPCNENLTDAEVEEVIRAVKELYGV